MRNAQKKQLKELDEQIKLNDKQNESLTNERFQLTHTIDEVQTRIISQTNLIETQKMDLLKQKQSMNTIQEDRSKHPNEMVQFEKIKEECLNRQSELHKQVYTHKN